MDEMWNEDDALDVFQKLLTNNFIQDELSEADTRSKLIDYVLINCMGWSESDLVREERCIESGTFLDYKLSTNIPLLIVEAKKGSVDFELPKSSSHRYYKIGGVLSKSNSLITAMIQARDYAISKGIVFCCVTNGYQYILFRSHNSQGIEWVDQRVILFRNLKDIEANFDLFCQLLSKESAAQGNLHKCIPLSTEYEKGETYRTLDTRHLSKPRKIDRNPLFPVIGDIIRRVFQDLSLEEAESEILKHCYVESPKKHDKKSPYIDRFTQRLNVSKKDAGDFQARILSALDTNRSPNVEVILLLGSVGVGKSTFLQRFRKVLAKGIIDESGIWIYLNFKHFSDTGQLLDNFIFDQFDKTLTAEYSDIGLNDWDFLKQAYHTDYEKLKRGALAPLFKKNPDDFELEFGKKLDLWIENKQEAHFIKLLSTAIKRLNKRVFLVFDNADQLDPNTQNDIFLAAQKLAEQIGCYALIAMREESYWKNRDSGPLSAFHTIAYHVQPPTLSQVVSKRFHYAKYLIENEPLVDLSGLGVTTDELLQIFDRLVQTLLGEDKSYIEFIESTAARDTRRALETIAAFMVSGHTNIEAILKDIRRPKSSGVLVPFHEFLNAVILRDHQVYTESSCDTINLFGVEGTSDASNFNRIAILGRILSAKNSKSSAGTGYTLIEQVLNDCHSVGILPETTISVMSFLVSRRILETETSIKDDISQSKYVRVTLSGEYYIEKLCTLFGYLGLIVFQTPIRGQECFKEINKAYEQVNLIVGEQPRDRLQRVKARLYLADVFLKYLESEAENSSFMTKPELFSNECTNIVQRIRRAFRVEQFRVIKNAEKVFG